MTFEKGDQVVYSSSSGCEYYAVVLGPAVVGTRRHGGATTPGYRIQILDFTRAHRDRMRATVPGWTYEQPAARYLVRTVGVDRLRRGDGE